MEPDEAVVMVLARKLWLSPGRGGDGGSGGGCGDGAAARGCGGSGRGGVSGAGASCSRRFRLARLAIARASLCCQDISTPRWAGS